MRRATDRRRTSRRCCSTSRSAAATSAWSCSALNNSGPRCTAAWRAMRGRIAHHAAVHLGPELFSAEQDQAEVAAALRDVEQHLLDVRLRSVARRILVQLVDENHDRVHAQLPPLELLAQLRDDAREYEILAERIDIRD